MWQAQPAAFSPQESQDSSRCGTSIDDTASCCSVKIPDHRSPEGHSSSSILKDSVFFFLCICVRCVSICIYLSVCVDSKCTVLSSILPSLCWFSTDPTPPPPPHPAHYPKQPTVINHYQSTHVSLPAFPLCLPPAYAPSHQPAYQLTRQQGLRPSLATPTRGVQGIFTNTSWWPAAPESSERHLEALFMAFPRRNSFSLSQPESPYSGEAGP